MRCFDSNTKTVLLSVSKIAQYYIIADISCLVFNEIQKAFLILSNMVYAQFGSVPGYFQDTLELRKRSPCDFAGKF